MRRPASRGRRKVRASRAAHRFWHAPHRFRQTSASHVTEYERARALPDTAVRRLPRRGLHALRRASSRSRSRPRVAQPRAAPPTYTGEAPVNSQSDDERVEALQDRARPTSSSTQTGDSRRAGAIRTSPRRSRRPNATCCSTSTSRTRRRRGGAPQADPDRRVRQRCGRQDAAAPRPRVGRRRRGRADRRDADRSDRLDRRHPLGRRLCARHRLFRARTISCATCSRSRRAATACSSRLSLATDLAHFLDAVGIERTLERRRRARRRSTASMRRLALGP